MILNILNELAANSSINKKVAILQREKDNLLLKRVFQAAYNPTITFGIKQIPTYSPSSNDIECMTLNEAIAALDKLVTREVTGNNAIAYLTRLLQALQSRDSIVLERIIQRDLRCNTSNTLAARVWPGLVPTFDVMLAHKDISHIKYPCYGQIKFDGARVNLIWNGNHASAWSRSGKEIQTLGVFDSTLKRINLPPNTVLDGELLVVDKKGVIADRKTGNGIINKANKGTIIQEEANSLRMVVWDIVDYTSTLPYSLRLKQLQDIFASAASSSNIRVADTTIINNSDEAQDMFERCIAAGHEGAMMKNIDHLWEPKRVKGIGKMKAEETADLRVIAVIEGSGKYANNTGAVLCETEDSLLQVSVGSGFSDDDRAWFWKHNPVGSIIEVKYNQKITSKGKSKASLFLPRYMQLRNDKIKANTMEELK